MLNKKITVELHVQSYTDNTTILSTKYNNKK